MPVSVLLFEFGFEIDSPMVIHVGVHRRSKVATREASPRWGPKMDCSFLGWDPSRGLRWDCRRIDCTSGWRGTTVVWNGLLISYRLDGRLIERGFDGQGIHGLWGMMPLQDAAPACWSALRAWLV